MKKFLLFLALFISLAFVLSLSVGAADGTESAENSALLYILIAVLVGFLAAGVSLFFMYRAMSTVRRQKRADAYVDEGSFSLSECRDVFLYSRVTRVRINTNNNKN
jgi:flagellar basal body-associated protein FliL